MKTILVDAVDCFVIESAGIFTEMYLLLENYPNPKIILTGANDEQLLAFGLDKMPYPVFTLKHSSEKTDPLYYQLTMKRFELIAENIIYFEHNLKAVKSAQSIGIKSFFYDSQKQDLIKLKEFLNNNL